MINDIAGLRNISYGIPALRWFAPWLKIHLSGLESDVLSDSSLGVHCIWERISQKNKSFLVWHLSGIVSYPPLFWGNLFIQTHPDWLYPQIDNAEWPLTAITRTAKGWRAQSAESQRTQWRGCCHSLMVISVNWRQSFLLQIYDLYPHPPGCL